MLEQALGSEAEGLGDEELLTPAGANLLLCPGSPLEVDLVLLLSRKLFFKVLYDGQL